LDDDSEKELNIENKKIEGTDPNNKEDKGSNV